MNYLGSVVRSGYCGAGDLRVDVKGLPTGLYTIKVGGSTAAVLVQ
jgi:hypothetical protein